MSHNEDSIFERGLPNWVADPKILLLLFIIAFFVFDAFRYCVNRIQIMPAKAPECAPLTTFGPYVPGTRSINALASDLRSGRSAFNLRQKKAYAHDLIDKIERCPLNDCSRANFSEYWRAIREYAWLRVVLTHDADVMSGDAGVKYINNEIFDTRDDDRIVQDLRARVSAKKVDKDIYTNDATLQMMVFRTSQEFAICRPPAGDP